MGKQKGAERGDASEVGVLAASEGERWPRGARLSLYKHGLLENQKGDGHPGA